MSALPAQLLVTLAMQGGERELDALARAWLPHVLRWCHRLGGPAIDAESAAHDTLLVVVRRLDRVESPAQFPSWLFAVTRGVVANHRRKSWFRRWVPGPLLEMVSPAAGPDRQTEQRQTADVVWRVLDRLPAEQREVLVLCELEERASSEVSELTGVPIGTVKSRLRLARIAFKKAFDATPGSARSAEVT